MANLKIKIDAVLVHTIVGARGVVGGGVMQLVINNQYLDIPNLWNISGLVLFFN